MIELDKLEEPEKKAIREMITKQIHIEEVADVEYMCYWLKIDSVDFWGRFLWE